MPDNFVAVFELEQRQELPPRAFSAVKCLQSLDLVLKGLKGTLVEVALPNSCCAFKKNYSAYPLCKLTEAESLASPYKGVSS